MSTFYDFIRLYTVEELQNMVPISQGHDSNLLLEREMDCRLWYSRMTEEDGAEKDHTVIVEVYNTDTKEWFTWRWYSAADITKPADYKHE